MPDYGLGRRQEHDERSRSFPFATIPVPIRTVLWPRYGPVLNQRKVGACTGFSAAHWLNCKPAHKPRQRYCTDQDGLEFYSGATQRDPFDGWYNLATKVEDTGSSGLAVCKELQARGRITGYRWLFEGVQQLAQALQVSPVLAGTVWLEGMFGSTNGYLNVTGNVIGGHEYVVVGYNTRSHYFTILNSWGEDWQRAGYARIRELDMAHLLDQRGDLVVPIL